MVRPTNTRRGHAKHDGSVQQGSRFFIGDKEVAKLTRAQVRGDGTAGLRTNANLHVQVSKLEVKKLPKFPVGANLQVGPVV